MSPVPASPRLSKAQSQCGVRAGVGSGSGRVGVVAQSQLVKGGGDHQLGESNIIPLTPVPDLGMVGDREDSGEGDEPPGLSRQLWPSLSQPDQILLEVGWGWTRLVA